MEQNFVKKLKERLKNPLPGTDVQFEMAHVKRERLKTEDINLPEYYKKSAVLILLCNNPSGLYIPLTERHSYKGFHSGQISLPGGKFEEQDVTLEATAIRECREEIGIKNNIELLGALTPVYIPVSSFLVQPFVATVSETNIAYNLNTDEVKSLLEFRIHDLLNPNIVKETIIEPRKGIKFKTPYFDVNGNVVWGATAMILNELKHLLK